VNRAETKQNKLSELGVVIYGKASVKPPGRYLGVSQIRRDAQSMLPDDGASQIRVHPSPRTFIAI